MRKRSAANQRLRDFDAPDAPLVAQIAVPPAELASCLPQCRAEYRAHAGCGVAQVFACDLNDADDLQRTVSRDGAKSLIGRTRHLRVLRVADEFRDGVRMFDDPPKPRTRV